MCTLCTGEMYMLYRKNITDELSLVKRGRPLHVDDQVSRLFDESTPCLKNCANLFLRHGVVYYINND